MNRLLNFENLDNQLYNQLKIDERFSMSKRIQEGDELKNLNFLEVLFSINLKEEVIKVEIAEGIIFKEVPSFGKKEELFLKWYQLLEKQKTIAYNENLLFELKSTFEHLFIHNTAEQKTEVWRTSDSGPFIPAATIAKTLSHGFKKSSRLNNPIKEAIYLHFLLNAIAPFVGENDRMARIFMNFTLEQNKISKILFPPSLHQPYRETDYLLHENLKEDLETLKANYIENYFKLMLEAIAFTNSIGYLNYKIALKQMEKANAFNS